MERDDIDALVDWQLAQEKKPRFPYEPRRTGVRCQCGGEWHGLPNGDCPGTFFVERHAPKSGGTTH